MRRLDLAKRLGPHIGPEARARLGAYVKGQLDAVPLNWSDVKWGRPKVGEIINDPAVAFWCAEAGILVAVVEAGDDGRKVA